jgi:polysaccharide export outer membrane protein
MRVTVWTGNEFSEQTLTVAVDGTIMIPFLVNKIVNVTGLTPVGIRNLIQVEMRHNYRTPVVQVIMTSLESKKALLVGEVARSGQFAVSNQTSVLEFVMQNGGYTPRANLTEVQVTRASGERFKLNLYDVVLEGDRSRNLSLQPDDIVFIPSVETISNKYFVLGEVRSPGVLQIQDQLTLLEAIQRSGSLAPNAKAEKVFVVRPVPSGGSEILEVAFSDLYKKGDLSQNILLRTGDIIYVPKSGLARTGEVLNAIAPLTGFIRDTLFIGTVFGRNP